MRIVNIEEFPYMWLYFCSGVIFNKLIREKLKKKEQNGVVWQMNLRKKPIIKNYLRRKKKNQSELLTKVSNEVSSSITFCDFSCRVR